MATQKIYKIAKIFELKKKKGVEKLPPRAKQQQRSRRHAQTHAPKHAPKHITVLKNRAPKHTTVLKNMLQNILRCSKTCSKTYYGARKNTTVLCSKTVSKKRLGTKVHEGWRGTQSLFQHGNQRCSEVEPKRIAKERKILNQWSHRAPPKGAGPHPLLHNPPYMLFRSYKQEP